MKSRTQRNVNKGRWRARFELAPNPCGIGPANWATASIICEPLPLLPLDIAHDAARCFGDECYEAMPDAPRSASSSFTRDWVDPRMSP